MADRLAVMDFLTNDCGIDLMVAAPLVNKFVESGLGADPDALWTLTKEEVNRLVSEAGVKRKINTALKKGKEKTQAPSPQKVLFLSLLFGLRFVVSF